MKKIKFNPELSHNTEKYGNFALLFFQGYNLLFEAYKNAAHIENEMLSEIKRLKKHLYLCFFSFVILPTVIVLLQLNQIKNLGGWSFESFIYLAVFLVLLLIGSIYYRKTSMMQLDLIQSLNKNRLTIEFAYSHLVDSLETDFILFLEKNYRSLSCFDNLDEMQLKSFVSALDEMNVDLNLMSKSFDQQLFLNSADLSNNEQQRQNAKQALKNDLKLFRV